MPQHPKTARVLLVPGLSNSGPEHWQSYWERVRTDCQRVEQTDWETPHRADWVAALDRAIDEAGGEGAGPVLLAAHSLGCATVAHWANVAGKRTRGKVRGALLVAPSDVEAPSYPPGSVGFIPVPLVRFPFASIVVASSDDRYVTVERAAQFARAWGSELADVGVRGHINSDSGLGEWAEGQALLDGLIAATLAGAQ